MKTHPFAPHLLLAAALAFLPAARAHADEATSQIAFSDPSKPGTLKIRVWHGEVSVHGADVKDISVKSEATVASPSPRKDGMRVLSASAGFTLSEKDNVAVLEYSSDGWTGGSSDFDVTVPRNTSIVVANSERGNIDCDGVTGDIDVRTMSGDVTLDGVSGGALVEAMKGDISVNVKALAAAKPLSFTSMRGAIALRLPEGSKANVRFRTHRGVILTNFSDTELVTKTLVTAKAAAKAKDKDKNKDKDKDKDEDASDGNVNVAVHVHTSDSDGDGDWHADVRDSIREAAREAADAAREAAEAVHDGLMEARIQFGTNIPPLPPMTGGKVVAGTLNGGGTEIQAATLSGDITLKKADKED